MHALTWILATVVALAFLAAGAMKFTKPRPDLITSGLTWAEDFSDGQVKAIGGLEVLGALGVVLPRLTGIAEDLSAVAAFGLAAVMAGAFVVHLRRQEAGAGVPSLVLGVLAAVVGGLWLAW